MEQFDKQLKEMADQEECMVPNGFDDKMKDVLDNLPPKAKRQGLGAIKGVLIAAAVCAALLGTAFAASPGLREMLATTLGGFAPYAQEQESEVYTWNGFEFKVLSALADENTIRVYMQVRDLEGRDRLDVHGETFRREFPLIEMGGLNSDVPITFGQDGSVIQRYDPATQTGIVVASAYCRISSELPNVEVRADTVSNMLDDPRNAAVQIPVDVKVLSSKTLLRNQVVNGIPVEEIRVSPLGVTLIAKPPLNPGPLLNARVSVVLKDGTEIESEYKWASGHIRFGEYGAADEGVALIWNLTDPLEADQIAGVYIREGGWEEYFPVK